MAPRSSVPWGRGEFSRVLILTPMIRPSALMARLRAIEKVLPVLWTRKETRVMPSEGRVLSGKNMW